LAIEYGQFCTRIVVIFCSTHTTEALARQIKVLEV